MKDLFQFTSKTKLYEILALDINVIAKLRWDEYQKCYHAKNFLWWEFYTTKDKSPVENFQLMYVNKFNIPISKDQLAKDFMLYIELKEQILSEINRLKLSEYYLLYCSDFGKYIANNKQRVLTKDLAEQLSFKNTKHVNNHLRVVH